MILGATVVLLSTLSQGPDVGQAFQPYPYVPYAFPPVTGAARPFGSEAFEGKPALIHVFASW